MKEKILLLCDCNNLIIRGMSVIPPLSYQNKFTGGVYGFLNQICRYILIHAPIQVIVCDDSPPYYRKELYKDYKKRVIPKTEKEREKKEEMFFKLGESRGYCFEVLDKLNIPLLRKEGFEADDVIATIVKNYHDKYSKIVIISNDSDLYQVLNHRNVLMDKGKTGLYSFRELIREYNITPDQWINVLSLAGSHNAVPPIEKGIGVKTAIKIMNDKEKLNETYKKHKQAIILRAQLGKLPFEPFTIEFELEHRKKKLFKNFIIYLKRKYGIEATDSMNKTFKGFLI